MNELSKIAGVVVLFNPDQSAIENIASYINYLDMLFVVDNSDKININIVKKLQDSYKVIYIANGLNLGIAAALNVGAQSALNYGFKWLFTFDQDSKATPEMIERMIGFLKENNTSQIGIVSPFQSSNDYKQPPDNITYSEELIVLTSGNLLNLNAYQNVGPFFEKLFIDYVDIEFCLRLRSKGYKIFRINSAILLHKLGDLKKKRFLYRNIAVTNHSAERMYYRVRNRFYVIQKYKSKYPKYCFNVLIQTLGDIIKIITYENDKINKLKMMLFGFIHFIRGIFGKLKS